MKPTLPEPEVLDRHLPTNTPITRGYTWKTVQRLIDEAYAAGLEDAAQACDDIRALHGSRSESEDWIRGTDDCAHEIRALKGKA